MCNGLHDAFTTYSWNGRSWPDNKRELDTFRAELRSAIHARDDDRAHQASAAILRWGRVWARNGLYLET